MKPSVLRRDFIKDYVDFRVDVPPGSHRLHEVRRYTMTETDLLVANAIERTMKTGRFTMPGTYTQLLRYGRNDNPYDVIPVMTDHTCEVADHYALVLYAKAHAPLKHVLINGLGIGVAIELLVPYVERFTIVEMSPSVIKLVAPHYEAKYPGRVEIIQADALAYKPPPDARYDAVFHDIWDFISHENLPQMSLLHRRYGRYTSWQQSWARNWCEREAMKRRLHPEQYETTYNLRELIAGVYRPAAS